jgi:hypothetical protein
MSLASRKKRPSGPVTASRTAKYRNARFCQGQIRSGSALACRVDSVLGWARPRGGVGRDRVGFACPTFAKVTVRQRRHTSWSYYRLWDVPHSDLVRSSSRFPAMCLLGTRTVALKNRVWASYRIGGDRRCGASSRARRGYGEKGGTTRRGESGQPQSQEPAVRLT